MNDEPYENAETNVAEENGIVDADGLLADAEVNEAHPNEDDIVEAEELSEGSS